MTKRTFIFISMAAGLAAFFIFRSYTHPLETALHWLLLSAFLSSSLLCAVAFSMLCRQVRRRWMRLVSVPGFLAAFTLLSGFGVFAATRLVFDSRPRDADSGGILYGDTSGMQMLAVDRGLWFHVIVAVALPLLLLSALGAITAFTGIRGSPVKKHAA
jgi:fluoride ion exporter CrcB/FEX